MAPRKRARKGPFAGLGFLPNRRVIIVDECISGTTEAFSRVKIDAVLKDAGRNLTDGTSVLFEPALPDGSRAHYALCGRSGRPVAVVETQRAASIVRQTSAAALFRPGPPTSADRREDTSVWALG